MRQNMKKRVQKWLDKDYRETFLERIELLLQSEKMFSDSPYAERYGLTLRHILDNMTIRVERDELLAGMMQERIPTEEEKLKYDEIYRRWWDKTDEQIHEEACFTYSSAWLRCRPPWFMSMGHLGFVWEEILENGLMHFRKKAEGILLTQSDPVKISFLNGCINCYDAIMHFIARHAEAAKEMGDEKSAMLYRISKDSPQTFAQALQLIWFIAFVAQKVCGCGVLNYSRLDHFLFPFFERDIKAGTLDEGTAKELLLEFFMKNNEIMNPVDHMSIENEKVKYTLEVTFDDPNYITLAGLLPDGSSGVNRLSHMMVEAAHELRLRNPFIVVRCHDGMDEAFWLKVCDAMRDNTTIVLYNDETMLRALQSCGVSREDAWNYGFFGCNDPVIAGKEGGLRQLWFNLAKPLELALNKGDYPMQPKAGTTEKENQFPIGDRMTGLMVGAYYGIDTGNLDDISTMEEFLQLYYRQMVYLLSEYRRGFEADNQVEASCNAGRLRIEDCFLEGTVEKAENWILGGTKYHKVVAQGTGLAMMTDSLYALDRFVFQDKKMSLSEFAGLLASNYAGNEPLADFLKKRYAKFGNDIDEVDKYATIVANLFTKAVQEVNGENYLYQLWPTLSSDRDYTLMGKYVGATPDGRRHGEPLSENQSPSLGCDTQGLTALLNSVSKVDFGKITGGPLNVRIHPSTVRGEDGLHNLAALLGTYMQRGGMQLQINVVDAAQLREAMQSPEKYKNLCVRVTGYSAFFTQMGEKAQLELISRTEHNM